eukprot:GHRQ01025199.1.p1 GENE.GHRQ01025199.1~~GHRQ01025199.1.p1  ORF type:complete len:134 (-),score=25.83 GHRQ01025199.1:248-649(-)
MSASVLGSLEAPDVQEQLLHRWVSGVEAACLFCFSGCCGTRNTAVCQFCAAVQGRQTQQQALRFTGGDCRHCGLAAVAASCGTAGVRNFPHVRLRACCALRFAAFRQAGTLPVLCWGRCRRASMLAAMQVELG